VRRAGALAIGALLLAACASTGPLDAALRKAGENRGELERVLRHYANGADPQKLEAARFLVSNMDGHGYTVAAFFDEEENEVPFDALDYASFKEAQAALDALEAEHGELHYGRKRFIPDLETITADLLIENIDLAFAAWRGRPWAKDVTFDAFLNYILPYRGSNEPLDSWRPECLEILGGIIGPMATTDPVAVAKGIRKEVHGRVRFDEIYYLHPTDQGFSEMCESGKGRCEDISNMMGYALRANAVLCATDYTPAWANRDNNHAWEVVLDGEGKGSAKLGNVAAKVYRKTYAIQPEALGSIREEDEETPRWLRGKNYLDVTRDYVETSDVTVRLEADVPEGQRFAYVCVFNGGEWKAIHWGRIRDGEVTFTRMGRRIAYLPAYYVDEEIVAAAPPFLLTDAGKVVRLAPEAGRVATVEAGAVAPKSPLTAGTTYELMVWDGAWRTHAKATAGEGPLTFEEVPAGALCWLVAEESRRLERIFTVEEGLPRWW
jgi:hypothetical protein